MLSVSNIKSYLVEHFLADEKNLVSIVFFHSKHNLNSSVLLMRFGNKQMFTSEPSLAHSAAGSLHAASLRTESVKMSEQGLL